MLAVRRGEVLVFFGLAVGAQILYAMNFRDGDIDRYYMPTIALAAPLIGVAVAFLGALVATAVAEISLRFEAGRTRRRVATAAAAAVVALAAVIPGIGLVGGYRSRPSANRAADAWVASVYDELPPNSVIVSWWSYSTLWYHRWILGARPDIRSSTSATSSTMATVRCAGPSSPTSAGGRCTSSRRHGVPGHRRPVPDQHRADLPRVLRDSQDRGTSPVTDAERPRLTFFFPAFNEEENVAETVRRALAEVGPLVDGSIEVLVVDDGSTDRTPELADELAAADARVRVHHQPNRGYGGALRAGFENARGELIGFSDGTSSSTCARCSAC